MSEELEALKRINHIYYYDENINDGETICIDLEEICKEDLDIIKSGLKRKEKLEKALKIIRKNAIVADLDFKYSYEEQCKFYHDRFFARFNMEPEKKFYCTKKEYEFLKEIFNEN